MTATAVHTPLLGGKSAKSGRGLYRKMLLPAGKTLTVNGQRLRLTPELFGQIKSSFDAGFMDVTPFTLVNDRNEHNDDPTAVRGRVRDLAVQSDGLYGLIDAPDELFTHNPDLPVSVRLKFDQERADGRKAPVVLAHVAGTNDPHVGGMKTWERVTDLSADSTPVVDLTAATYQGDNMASPFTDEETALLRGLLERLSEQPSGDGAADQTADTDSDELTDDELTALESELEQFDDTDGGDEQPETDQADEPETADEPELVGASLSASGDSVDLAAIVEQQRSELAAVQEQLHTEQWQARRRDLVGAGVPPFLVDLAAPVLSKPAKQVDLAAGDTDPYAVIHQMLDKCRGMVDLASERGVGHITEPDEAAEVDEFVNRWKSQF